MVRVEKPGEINCLHSPLHFTKTAEDIAEMVVGSIPGVKFGIAFCKASGDYLTRVEGNDEVMMFLV
jgi:uncharacterized protein